MNAFSELALILLLTFLISVIIRILKQPLIIGYIVSGIIAGPFVLNILHSVELIELLSKIGITSLLFIIGLGLSPKVLKELGISSLFVGLGQVIFTILLSFGLSYLLGYEFVTSIFISIAITFSSTIIVLKLLTDRGDINKLYGRVSIGILLVQDLVATIALVLIAGFKSTSLVSIDVLFKDLFILLATGFVLLVVLFLISTQILSRLTNFVSRSQEFLFIFSLAWGLSIAYMYQRFGLSLEIGALVAGVTLSMTPYSTEISSRLKPLRDFFVLMFFILLGSQMNFSNYENLIYPISIFVGFIIIFKPIIIFFIMNLLGYNKKNSFLTGLSLAQISEFSLILMNIGRENSYVNSEVLSIITIAGVISIALSSYLITFNESIYNIFSNILGFLEIRKNPIKERKLIKEISGIIFGYNRAGPEYARMLDKQGIRYLVVDFNPETVSKYTKEGVNIEYGDASDIEFLEELPIENLKIAISTVPDFNTNLMLTRFLRSKNEHISIFVPAESKKHAMELYALGATHVVLSHYIGAKHTSLMVTKLGFEDSSYKKFKEKHLKELI